MTHVSSCQSGCGHNNNGLNLQRKHTRYKAVPSDAISVPNKISLKKNTLRLYEVS